ncbi:MAG: hypothetical protein AAEJ47_11450, partial [Planctomycetota bacterium]
SATIRQLAGSSIRWQCMLGAVECAIQLVRFDSSGEDERGDPIAVGGRESDETNPDSTLRIVADGHF